LDKIDDAIKRKGRTDFLCEVKKPNKNLINKLKLQFNIKSNKSFDNISEIYEEILAQ
jgi:hypothetical protein